MQRDQPNASAANDEYIRFDDPRWLPRFQARRRAEIASWWWGARLWHRFQCWRARRYLAKHCPQLLEAGRKSEALTSPAP